MNKEELVKKHPGLAGKIYFGINDEIAKIGCYDIHKTQLDKKKVLEIIEHLKERFGAKPRADKGESQDRFISYLDLKKELGL